MPRALGTAVPTIELSYIPDGEPGIRATVQKMVELARQYRKHPVIRQLAVELTEKIQGKDFRAEARRLWDFVRTYVRFVRDIRDVETLQTPLRTLQNRAGDCDDHATLLGTLLQSIGHPVRFVAMGFSGPAEYCHVLAETLIGDRWVPVETTLDVDFGWAPPRQRARMELYV